MAEDSLHTSKYSLPYPAPESDVKPATEDFKDLAISVETNLSEAESRASQSVTALHQEVIGRDYISGTDSRAPLRTNNPAWAWAVTDQDGRVAGGVASDGRWDFGTDPTVNREARVAFRRSSDTEVAWAVTDGQDRAALAVYRDGSIRAPGLRPSYDLASDVASSMIAMTRSDRSRFACVGDSQTASVDGWPASETYPGRLQALVPSGVTVGTRARAGWTCDEILIGMGVNPLTVTIPAGEIPASANVDVVVTGGEQLGWSPPGSTRAFYGTLAGVPGRLIRTNSATEMYFDRHDDGEAVTATGDLPWVSDWESSLGNSIIAQMGRNDVSHNLVGRDGGVAAHVVASYERLERAMSADIRQFLALSITNRQSEPRGHWRYKVVMDTNARLAEKYGPRFLDFRTLLVERGLAEAGIEPTPEDIAAMQNDCIPPSLMDDDTHYNRVAAGLIAQYIYDYLAPRDWIAS